MAESLPLQITIFAHGVHIKDCWHLKFIPPFLVGCKTIGTMDLDDKVMSSIPCNKFGIFYIQILCIQLNKRSHCCMVMLPWFDTCPTLSRWQQCSVSVIWACPHLVTTLHFVIVYMKYKQWVPTDNDHQEFIHQLRTLILIWRHWLKDEQFVFEC